MAFALVGSAGVATQGAVTTAVTPAWGAGSSRTAGNLLICFVSVTGAAGTPTVSGGGWKPMSLSGTSCTASVQWRVATGGDTAPTINALNLAIISAHLEEWSGIPVGALTSNVDDQQGSSAGIASPVTATLGAADANPAVLVAMAAADFRSAARASADTWTSNHGTPTLRASNNGVSSAHHYSHATLITNSNTGADTAVMTASVTTSITGLVVAAVSFDLAPSLTPVTGTGAGTGTASASGGTAAEMMSGTGGGTGAAATASGTGTVGSPGATGTGAGTQAAQTATGTGVETITGTGASTPPPASSAGSGTSLLAAIGTGAGTGVASSAVGAGSSLLAAVGSGAGEQVAASATGDGLQVIPGGGVQVPQSGYGEGTVAGGEVEVPPGQGSSLYMPRLRLLIGGTGAGVQAPQTATGTGRVNDDDLVVMAA